MGIRPFAYADCGGDHLTQISASFGRITGVITEHAALDVKPGEERAFEQAFHQAKTIIASMPGFISLSLDRCLEVPTRYLLLVRWERLEDHMRGFRESSEYQEWRALLHHFYDPFPTVHHYQRVTEIP